MSGFIIPEDHLCLNLSSEVKAICKPLFEMTELVYFHYVRCYKDATAFSLITHPDWQKYAFRRRLFFYYEEAGKYLKLRPGETKQYAPLIYNPNLRDDFHQVRIDHMLQIITLTEDYYDLYGFATYPNNHKINDFYLTHNSLLKNFIPYFKQQAADLIALVDKYENRIHINKLEKIDEEVSDPFKREYDFCAKFSVNDFDELLDEIFKNNNTFQLKSRTIQFTQRELSCLRLLARGRSSKEIGRLLSISHRTVEAHIIHIKEKLGCNLKSEILDFIWENREFFYRG